jgi:hypothetical protein
MTSPDQSLLTQRINQVRAKELEIDAITQSLFQLDKVSLVDISQENTEIIEENKSTGNCPSLIHQLLSDRGKANLYRNLQ